MGQRIDVAEAKAYIEANYQGDPLLRHLFMTMLDKLPKVAQKEEPAVNIVGKQPAGALAFAYACGMCRNAGSTLCRECKMEVKGSFEPRGSLVDVVRCKECVHRHTRAKCQGRSLDWYCPDGERRTNG